MNKDINIKRTLLKAVKEIKSDLSKLSLKDIIVQFSHDVDEYDKVIREKEQEVIDKYTNTYLKFVNENSNLYDKEIELLHIVSLETSSYTTEWDRTYQLSGERICFSNNSFYKRTFGTSVYDNYTENKLLKFIEITKEEYDSYNDKFESLNTILSEIINNN
jgi:hypothetical protein